MFSAGADPIPPAPENFAVALPGHTNPTGLDPASGTADTWTTADSAATGLQAGAALVNAITSWACYGIQNRMQENHIKAMTEIAEIKKGMQLEAISSQLQKMQVVEAVTKHRTAAREEHARASSELKIAKAELAEQKATRKAGKVDRARLDALFSRNERPLGNPARGLG